MHEAEMGYLIQTLQGLWPNFKDTTERRQQLLLMFERSAVQDVAEAFIRWSAEHPDTWPRFGEVKELLEVDRATQWDPAEWTIADEVQLNHMMIQELDLAARTGKAARSEDEVARDRIGKNPSQQEREDAWARLNRQIDTANAERMRNGSGLRCSHYPAAQYYWVDEHDNEIPPPTTRAPEATPPPRIGRFRSRVMRGWFDRKHGAEPIGDMLKRRGNP